MLGTPSRRRSAALPSDRVGYPRGSASRAAPSCSWRRPFAVLGAVEFRAAQTTWWRQPGARGRTSGVWQSPVSDL